MAKKRKRKSKSNRGYLVKGYLPPVSRKLIEVGFFKKEIKDMLRHNSGIYALYMDKQLYYVGIATDLSLRLYNHTRDKHKDKWNRFSAFIISRGRYLKDIESILHRTSEPSANVWKGKFKEHYEYDNQIKNLIKKTHRMFKELQKDM